MQEWIDMWPASKIYGLFLHSLENFPQISLVGWKSSLLFGLQFAPEKKDSSYAILISQTPLSSILCLMFLIFLWNIKYEYGNGW